MPVGDLMIEGSGRAVDGSGLYPHCELVADIDSEGLEDCLVVSWFALLMSMYKHP